MFIEYIMIDYGDALNGVPDGEVRDRRTNDSIRIYTPSEIEAVRQACRIGAKSDLT